MVLKVAKKATMHSRKAMAPKGSFTGTHANMLHVIAATKLV
jgi:hypothetical protein